MLFFGIKKKKIIDNFINLDVFLNLKEQEKIVYLGFDCTSNNFHFGHVFQLVQSFRLMKQGFKILYLLGDYTALIGDPSDKNKERQKIKFESIKEYKKKLKEQLNNILKLDKLFLKTISFSPLEFFFENELLKKIYNILGINLNFSIQEKWKKFCNYIFPFFQKKKPFYKIIENSHWIKKINYLDFLNTIGRNININYLLAKDWIKTRKEKYKINKNIIEQLPANFRNMKTFGFLVFKIEHSINF